jgi:hypothetical protein
VSRGDRALGIGVGVLVGVGAVVLFVFVGSEQTIDEPGLEGNRAGLAERARLPTIRVVDGLPAGGVRRLEVDRGRRIRFRVSSDVVDDVRIEGYGVTRQVRPGHPVSFDLRARRPGSFEVKLVAGEAQLAELRVR